MLVVAMSCKDHEFLYKPSTAHKVSKASAQKICDILNQYKYRLVGNSVWHIHEVGMYEDAYDYAQYQRFTIRKGIVKEFCV